MATTSKGGSRRGQEHHRDSPPGRGMASSRTPHGVLQARSPRTATSFLTAATLIYAIGAGITTAAGTRLAPRQAGSLTGAVHLSNVNAGVLRRPQSREMSRRAALAS